MFPRTVILKSVLKDKQEFSAQIQWVKSFLGKGHIMRKKVEKNDANPILVNYHHFMKCVCIKSDDYQNPEQEADENSAFIVAIAPLLHSLQIRPFIICPLPNTHIFYHSSMPSLDTYHTILLHISQTCQVSSFSILPASYSLQRTVQNTTDFVRYPCFVLCWLHLHTHSKYLFYVILSHHVILLVQNLASNTESNALYTYCKYLLNE